MPDNKNALEFGVSRRSVLKAAGAGAALAAFAGVPGRVLAAEPLKVAAVYTVPVDLQWVSRIHKAAYVSMDLGYIDYVYS